MNPNCCQNPFRKLLGALQDHSGSPPGASGKPPGSILESPVPILDLADPILDTWAPILELPELISDLPEPISELQTLEFATPYYEFEGVSKFEKIASKSFPAPK